MKEWTELFSKINKIQSNTLKPILAVKSKSEEVEFEEMLEHPPETELPAKVSYAGVEP